MNDPERLDLPSASEMYRNSECHGNRIFTDSLRGNGLLGAFQPSDDAKLGTRIHASLAGEPEDLYREAQETRDECSRIATEASMQFFGYEPREIRYEQRFWYHIADIPFFSGKPDCVHINSERILDINFKTGREPEEESSLNLQLRTEVVLLKHRYPEIKEIGAVIVQPWVTHTPEIAIYDEEACHKALIEILEIVDATAWDATRKAGPWCKYCPARAFCPEARALATRYPATINVEALPSGQAASEMLDKVNVAYDVLDALWEAFKAKVKADPESVPGWRIGKGKKIRSWHDALGVFKKACEYDEVAAYDIIDIPFGKLEDALNKKWGIGGKAFEKRFEHEYGSWIKTKQTAGSLERVKQLKDK